MHTQCTDTSDRQEWRLIGLVSIRLAKALRLSNVVMSRDVAS